MSLADDAKGPLSFLFHYFSPYTIDLIISVLCVIISSGSILSLGFGLKYLVNTELSNIWVEFVAFFCFFGFLVSGSIFGRMYCANRVGQKVVAKLRKDVHKHLLHSNPEFFEKYRVVGLISIIISDIAVLENFIAGGFTVMLRHALTMLVSLALVFYSNFSLAVDVLLIIPLGLIIKNTIGIKVKKISKTIRESVAGLGISFEDSIANLKLIQAFSWEDSFTHKFAKSADACSEGFIRYSLYRAVFIILVILSVLVIVIFVLWRGLNQINLHQTDSGSLLSFLFYMLMAVGGFSGCSDSISDLQQSMSAIKRVMELLQDKTGFYSSVEVQRTSEDVIECNDIKFENVCFAYPKRKSLVVLSGYSLDIAAGETIALVGKSGSGKSTILNLLMRFHDVAQGSIMIDGVNIRDLAIGDLRKIFGWVPQESLLLSVSVRDNLCFDRDSVSEARIMEVLDQVDLLQFIQSLPDGLDTVVGERGCDFSGGQKQRLSIVRALLKNPQILLFDEATSSLDTNSEAIIQNTMFHTYRDKTKIIISHRLSTIIKSDRIAVMDNGSIKEIGNHQYLMGLDGLYTQLIKANLYN